MKICNTCNAGKDLTEYHRDRKGHRGSCKECVLKKHHPKIPRDQWKPNSGRFVKGQIPKAPFVKGLIPWNKHKRYGVSRAPQCGKYKLWRDAIIARDNGKCQKCGSSENLQGHHLKSWKDDESLRFDVDNGLTLCRSCHSREEGVLLRVGIGTRFKKGHVPSEETRRKIGESRRNNRLGKNGDQQLNQQLYEGNQVYQQ